MKDLEQRAAEYAASVVSCNKEAKDCEGLICTAYVLGATEQGFAQVPDSVPPTFQMFESHLKAFLSLKSTECGCRAAMGLVSLFEGEHTECLEFFLDITVRVLEDIKSRHLSRLTLQSLIGADFQDVGIDYLLPRHKVQNQSGCERPLPQTPR